MNIMVHMVREQLPIRISNIYYLWKIYVGFLKAISSHIAKFQLTTDWCTGTY